MSVAATTVLFVLLGLSVGSFVNLCIDRLPADQSILRPGSHCQLCERRLRVPDLIPVISYVLLRGRCRYCGSTIGLRSPLVEAATAIIFAFLYWNYDWSVQLGISLFYAALFIIIIVIDFEHQLILNKVVYPALPIALAFSFFWPDLGIGKSILGGLTGFAVMLALYFIFQGGFGEGDIKLTGLLGLITGFPMIGTCLLLGVVSGGAAATVLLVSGLRGRREAIPFGPFLAGGAFVTLLWGQTIWDWYIGLFT